MHSLLTDGCTSSLFLRRSAPLSLSCIQPLSRCARAADILLSSVRGRAAQGRIQGRQVLDLCVRPEALAGPGRPPKRTGEAPSCPPLFIATCRRVCSRQESHFHRRCHIDIANATWERDTVRAHMRLAPWSMLHRVRIDGATVWDASHVGGRWQRLVLTSSPVRSMHQSPVCVCACCCCRPACVAAVCCRRHHHCSCRPACAAAAPAAATVAAAAAPLCV
jgi:hypothetical protein